MVFTGTLTDINAALNGMTYNPTANFNGSSTLSITTNDQGNSGSGGPLSDTKAVIINVSAVNDAPINTVPPTQTVNEDTALTFSAANSNAITVSDVDVGAGSEQITLTITNGTLSLSQTAGLTFTTGTGINDGTMVFIGTLTDINAALNGMTYNPTANFNGSSTLSITTNDQGNTGSGGPLSDTKAVTINVSAVNDAPINTVPPTQTVNEDTALTFSSANSNAITVSDVDVGAGSEQITLTITNGTLSLSQTTGLTFTTGTGTNDGTMVFRGTLTDINAALNGMTYNPTANFNGSSILSITTNDQGNSGSGGPLSDTKAVTINVSAVNDAPINTVPSTQTTNEDTTLTFSSANSNAITVSDVDVGAGSEQITLTITNGTLSLSQTAGLTFTTGTGINDGTMVFTGTLTDINAALNGMTYNPTANFNGSSTLSITTNDQGNTGSGGPLSDTKAVIINVSAVNDAPVNTVPTTQTTNEDTALTFSSANSNAITVSDVDVGAGSEQITLTITNGTLSLSQTAGLTFTTGTGINDGTMVFTGD